MSLTYTSLDSQRSGFCQILGSGGRGKENVRRWESIAKGKIRELFDLRREEKNDLFQCKAPDSGQTLLTSLTKSFSPCTVRYMR